MEDDLIQKLEAQNNKYWEVRNRVASTQARLRISYFKKRSTREKTNRLIKNGTLKKVPCTVCGSEQVQVHHFDYTDPKNVTFLCEKHHRDWHSKNT